MIIYGWNSKVIKEAPLEGHTCAHCNEQSSNLIIQSKYIHIFWIPLFPYKKQALIYCSHCQNVTEEKNLSVEQKDKMKVMKGSVPTPKYLFAGLAAIILAISFLIYSSGEQQNREAEMINNPLIGDVYKLYNGVETTEYKYYLWKVSDIVGDSLYVSPSSFSYDGIPYQLDKEDGFYDVAWGIHKDEVLVMYDKGEIKSVERDYDEDTGFMRVVAFPSLPAEGSE